MFIQELTQYPPYYEGMYKLIAQDISLSLLLEHRLNALEFYRSIPEDKWDYQYAEGKWSIKKLVRHIIDAELIFDYRALSIVRGEKRPLMGWSENEYADQVDDNKLSKENLLKSLDLQFRYTADLFQSFDQSDLKKTGNTNTFDVEVGAIGFCIIAHEMHHRNTIRERYLN